MPRIASYSSSDHSPLSGSSDPIVDAIRLLRPRTVIEPGFHGSGTWCQRYDPFPHVKIGGVVQGHCWLILNGHEPLHLREGDMYLMGNPPPYLLASSQTAMQRTGQREDAEASDGMSVSSRPDNSSAHVRSFGDGETYLCGGHFSFDDANAQMLLEVLPPIVCVRSGDPRGKPLAHLSALLVSEAEATAAGSSLVLDHLAQIMFVHMLRAHAGQADRPAGWLGALSDDGIGAALRAMHSDVAHRWTLQELAGISCMSRSAFAATFKRQVGTTPLDYLIEWRMSLARDALRRGTRSIAELAMAIGYESESAFSTAFRRVVGTSPKQFRDGALTSAMVG